MLAPRGSTGSCWLPLMWCEDAIPRAAAVAAARPAADPVDVLPGARPADFVPFQLMIRGSGAVCTMQLSGMLRREGTPFWSVAGHARDPAVMDEIESLARAMAVRRALDAARVGMLPFPVRAHVRHMGGRVRPPRTLRGRGEAPGAGAPPAHAPPSAPTTRCARFGAALSDSGARVEVKEPYLGQGIRYALAMQRLVREEATSRPWP